MDLFLTFFLKIGWVGSKPPNFFLKHHRVANYNIGRFMAQGMKNSCLGKELTKGFQLFQNVF